MMFNGYDPALAALLAGEDRSLAAQEESGTRLGALLALIVVAAALGAALVLGG